MSTLESRILAAGTAAPPANMATLAGGLPAMGWVDGILRAANSTPMQSEGSTEGLRQSIGTDLGQVLQGTLGASADQVRNIDYGYSTLDQQSYSREVNPTMLASFRGQSWQRQFVNDTAIFVSKATGSRRDQVVHTGVSVSSLNALMEAVASEASERNAQKDRDATVAAATRASYSGRERVRDFVAEYGSLGAMTPNELFSKWEYAGVVASLSSPTMKKLNYRTRGQQSIVGLSIRKRRSIFNYFDVDIRAGDALHFAPVEVCVDGHGGIMAPDGSMLSTRPGIPGARAMQLIGSASRGSRYLSGASGSDSADHFAGPVDYDHIMRDDADSSYVERERRLAMTWTEVEVDSNGELRVRNLATEEGLQETLASIPEVVYGAVVQSKGIYVGCVHSFLGPSTSAASIRAAHRLHSAAVAAGRIQLV